MTKLICPTIDLFLYDLGHSLDDSSKDISQNRQYFQAKLHPAVQEQLLPIDTNNLITEYKHLLNKPHYAPLLPDMPLGQGYYYPVQLGDSYGLLLEYTHLNKKEPQSADCFVELKNTIEQKLEGKTATLGQTWMLSAYVSAPNKYNEAEIETTAKDCYKAIMPDLNWDAELDGQGEFLGANIFELSSTQLSQKKVTIDQQEKDIITQDNHVIIAIYPDEKSFNLLADFYTDWMRVFYYHHKILWAYGQSRLITKVLKQEFGQIYTEVEAIENRLYKNRELEKLKDILIKTQSKLSFYTVNLHNLNFQTGTIEVNLNNYQKRIQTLIEKQKKKHIQTDLAFLKNFTKITEEKYLLQITKDSENLELGLKLLEDIINGVRGRVELEKAQQDKNFHDIITIVGIGWATASTIGEILKPGEFTDEPIKNYLVKEQKLPDKSAESIASFVYSVSFAAIFIFAFVIWRILKTYWLKIDK